MQLAVQSKLLFCLPQQRWDLVAFAKNLAVHALELDDDLSLQERQLDTIRQRLMQADQGIFSFHLPCPCWPLTSPRIRTSSDRIRLGIERARRLDAKAVVLVPRTPGGVSIADAQASYHQLTAYALSLAGPLGLGVSINNSGLHASAFSHPDYFDGLLRAHGGTLQMTLDVANCPLGGHCPEQTVRHLAPFLTTIHLKDWTIPQQQGRVTSIARQWAMQLRRQIMSSPLGGAARKLAERLGIARHVPRVVCGTDGIWYQGTTIGDGIMDIPRCLERLQQIGFRGYLCIEYEGTGDLESALRTGVTRVRSMLTRIAATASPPLTDSRQHSST